MTVAIAALRPCQWAAPAARPRLPQQSRRRVKLVWGLLILNVLTFYAGSTMVLPLPAAIGRIITQGALLVALLVVLSVNRPAAVRPSVFILLLAVLAAEALVASLRSEFVFGAMFRVCRLIGFIAVLWLLTPWWARRDLLLVRAHLTAVWVVLGTVVLGVMAAPGWPAPDGRLAGILWPIPPSQVGHYAAIVIGLTAVLWMTRVFGRGDRLGDGGRRGHRWLLLTHTGPRSVAMMVGLVIAGVSLFPARSRVRKTFQPAWSSCWVGVVPLSTDRSPPGSPAGRTPPIGAAHRPDQGLGRDASQARGPLQHLFGWGLSNRSFNGLPIDSNWFGRLLRPGHGGGHDLRLDPGVPVLIGAAGTRPRGPHRALALFVVVYCVVASFTETGLSDAPRTCWTWRWPPRC